MKSFTAKEFSRCPAKVYEAAREDKEVELTHDRFNGKFYIVFVSNDEVESIVSDLEGNLQQFIDGNQERNLGQFMADNIGAVYPNGLGQLLDLNKKATD